MLRQHLSNLVSVTHLLAWVLNQIVQDAIPAVLHWIRDGFSQRRFWSKASPYFRPGSTKGTHYKQQPFPKRPAP